MNRQTRDKITSGTDTTDLTTGNACWETAPRVFEQLVADFGPFDLDLTADPVRRLVERWFGPGGLELDALKANWIAYGKTGYSNPPYGPFVQMILAVAEWQAKQGFTSTLLLPMRVTKAFRRYILASASDLLFCDHRLYFFENGLPRLNEKNWREKGIATPDSALFDSIVVRFSPDRFTGRRSLNVGEWRVPIHVTPQDLERAAEARRLLDSLKGKTA